MRDSVPLPPGAIDANDPAIVRFVEEVQKATRRRDFRDNFAASFLAGYAVAIYGDCCANGEHDRLRNLPVEDAYDLADSAFDNILELGL